MSVKVMVPGSLRSWFDGADEVLCEGSTVGQCLEQLGQRFPGLKTRLFTPDNEIGAVIVFLNGDNIRKGDGLGTPVSDGDEIGIVPLAAGG